MDDILKHPGLRALAEAYFAQFASVEEAEWDISILDPISLIREGKWPLDIGQGVAVIKIVPEDDWSLTPEQKAYFDKRRAHFKREFHRVAHIRHYQKFFDKHIHNIVTRPTWKRLFGDMPFDEAWDRYEEVRDDL